MPSCQGRWGDLSWRQRRPSGMDQQMPAHTSFVTQSCTCRLSSSCTGPICHCADRSRRTNDTEHRIGVCSAQSRAMPPHTERYVAWDQAVLMNVDRRPEQAALCASRDAVVSTRRILWNVVLDLPYLERHRYIDNLCDERLRLIRNETFLRQCESWI